MTIILLWHVFQFIITTHSLPWQLHHFAINTNFVTTPETYYDIYDIVSVQGLPFCHDNCITVSWQLSLHNDNCIILSQLHHRVMVSIFFWHLCHCVNTPTILSKQQCHSVLFVKTSVTLSWQVTTYHCPTSASVCQTCH